MPSLSVTKTFLREVFTTEQTPRVNEPDLVMDDPDKVAAYTRAGREDGVMAPVYLFHCAQICELVRPGDTVIDLGCGPATQMAMAARLNPRSQFIGLDLSPEMLERAHKYVEEQELHNVEFRVQDITRLASFADNSADVVVSTVALHHLPDVEALEASIKEVARVLKPGGGVYLVDFGRLRAKKSIEDFAHQYADRQPELFTLDYLYSLHAAFSKEEFKALVDEHLAGNACFYSTFVMPFMMAAKSPPREGKVDEEVVRQLHAIRDQLPENHKTDLKDLMTMFRLGRLRSPLLS